MGLTSDELIEGYNTIIDRKGLLLELEKFIKSIMRLSVNRFKDVDFVKIAIKFKDGFTEQKDIRYWRY